jgi:hypothetical protein
VQLMRGISAALEMDDFSVAEVWSDYAKRFLDHNQ